MRHSLIPSETERWGPFKIQRDIQAEMNRVFGQTLEPRVDLKDEKDRLVVKADVPGIKKEELTVTVHDNLLTLKVERKESMEKKEKEYFYSERFEGSFIRTIELPSRVKADAVKAVCKDGVLEITMPKDEHAGSKEVEIRIE